MRIREPIVTVDDAKTAANEQSQLQTAENKFRRVLATPNAPAAERIEAELGLKQVQQARFGDEGANASLRSNKLLSGLFSGLATVNQALGVVAGGTKELTDVFRDGEDVSFKEFVTQVSGIDTRESSFVRNLSIAAQTPLPVVYGEDGFEARDLALQASFGDVIGDLGGDSRAAVTARVLTSFGLDVVLDPTTYLGGAGLLKGSAAGATKGSLRAAGRGAAKSSGVFTQGSELVTRGLSREVIARELINTAATVASKTEREALENFARGAAGFGVHNARRNLDDVSREIIDEYVNFGVHLRTPFGVRISRNSKRDLDKVWVIPGTDNALTSGFRRGVENLGTKSLAGFDSLAIGGLKGPAFRAAAKNSEAFTGIIRSTDVIAAATQTGVKFRRGARRQLAVSLPDVELNRSGAISRKDGSTFNKLRSPEFGEQVRENLSQGVTTGEVDGLSFNFVAETIDSVADVAREYGVNLGNSKDLFADLSVLEDIGPVYGGLSTAERKTFIAEQNFRVGQLMGFKDNGVPVLLRSTEPAEIDGLLSRLSRDPEAFNNPFGGDILESLDNFVDAAADLVQAEELRTGMFRAGIGSFEGAIRSRPVTEIIESASLLSAFRSKDIDDIVAKILPQVAERQQAAAIKDSAKNTKVRRLTSELDKLRQRALMDESVEDIFRSRLLDDAAAGLAGKTEKQRRTIGAYVREVDREHGKMLSARQLELEIDELKFLGGVTEGTSHAPSVARRLKAAEAELAETRKLLETVTPIMDELEGGLGKQFDSAKRSELRGYRKLAMELAQNKPEVELFARPQHAGFVQTVIDDVIGAAKVGEPAFKQGTLFDQVTRKGLFSAHTIETSVVEALSSAKVGELATTVNEVASGILTKGELAKLKPMLDALDDLVRLDNVSIKTIRNFPARAADHFAKEAMRTTDTTSELFGVARDFMQRAEEVGAEIDRLIPKGEGDQLLTNEVRGQLANLKVEKNLLEVHAQEGALMAELSRVGSDFGGERFLSFVEGMSPSQWQAMVNTMSHDADKLIPVRTIAGLKVADDDIAQAIEAKARFMSDPNVAVQVTRRLTKLFKPQATLTPGFSVRNLYGAAHMNWLTAGVNFSDYKVAEAVLVTARKAILDPANKDEILGTLTVRQRKILTEIERVSEVIFPENTKLDDALRSLNSETGRRTTVGRKAEERLGADSRVLAVGDDVLRGVKNLGEFYDRTAAGVFGSAVSRRNRLALKGGQQASDYTVEELMRFSQMYTLMDRGAMSTEAAHSTMIRTHFDYADLTVRDMAIRDSAFPFWTFMSRNIPLQIELLAKKPGAFNNLVAFQEQLNKAEQGGLLPEYFDNRLNYTVPEEVWLIGGDQLTPDLGFNDVIQRTNEIGNLGGPDPVAGFNMVLGDASPWTQRLFELTTGRSAFSSANLDEWQTPVTDNVFLDEFADRTGTDPNAVTHVLGMLFQPLGWSRYDPVDPYDPDSARRWHFHGQANQTLSSFLPLVGQQSRLFAPNDDSENKDARRVAAWISYLSGGVRGIDNRAYLSRAYGLNDDATALLDELSNYAVPEAGGSQRGRRRIRG